MKTYKILIADDDPDFLEQIKLMLSSDQFELFCAKSQKETEELLGKIKPDLAILDVIMEQDDSGFVLAHKVKKMYPDVPVIIFIALLSADSLFNNNILLPSLLIDKSCAIVKIKLYTTPINQDNFSKFLITSNPVTL
jgi:CheY-like chemotaxis protein